MTPPSFNPQLFHTTNTVVITGELPPLKEYLGDTWEVTRFARFVTLNLIQHLVFRPRNKFGVTLEIGNESLSNLDWTMDISDI